MNWKQNYEARNDVLSYVNALIANGMEAAEVEAMLCAVLAVVRSQIMIDMALKLKEPEITDLVVEGDEGDGNAD